MPLYFGDIYKNKYQVSFFLFFPERDRKIPGQVFQIAPAQFGAVQPITKEQSLFGIWRNPVEFKLKVIKS